MVYLGADHGGFELKEKIKEYLKLKNISYEDLGTYSKDSVDYPDYAFAVGEKVVDGDPEKNRGVMVCTTGLGACVAVNKIKGIRGAMGYSEESIKKARLDVDVNVLCLGGTNNHEEAVRILEAFLETPFSEEERHARRVNKIKQKERQ